MCGQTLRVTISAFHFNTGCKTSENLGSKQKKDQLNNAFEIAHIDQILNSSEKT